MISHKLKIRQPKYRILLLAGPSAQIFPEKKYLDDLLFIGIVEKIKAQVKYDLNRE